jgi:hypothetical protein
MDQSTLYFRFLLAVLATWRVTHLLSSEDGPADLIVRFRARLGQSMAGKLLDCFHCLSLWIAAPLAVFVSRTWLEWLLAWLATSGAACLLERLGREPVVIEHLPQTEGEDENHVLRSETVGVLDGPGADGNAGRSAGRAAENRTN